jgi:hypothetical protein
MGQENLILIGKFQPREVGNSRQNSGASKFLYLDRNTHLFISSQQPLHAKMNGPLANMQQGGSAEMGDAQTQAAVKSVRPPPICSHPIIFGFEAG